MEEIHSQLLVIEYLMQTVVQDIQRVMQQVMVIIIYIPQGAKDIGCKYKVQQEHQPPQDR